MGRSECFAQAPCFILHRSFYVPQARTRIAIKTLRDERQTRLSIACGAWLTAKASEYGKKHSVIESIINWLSK